MSSSHRLGINPSSPTRMLAPPDRVRHVAVFNVLWAIAHLGHVLRKEPVHQPLVWLLVLACVLVVQRPRSAGRLAFLALAQVALFLRWVPSTDNHMYIMAFANAGLLVIAAGVYLRGGAWRLRDLEGVTAFVALVFTVSYAAAAISKLNHGFFGSAASCAVTMFYDAVAIAGVLPGAAPGVVEGALPWLVAGAELAIPLLLVVPRTRLAGIWLLVLFHLGISFSPTATALDFTLLLFAFGYLLLPAAASERVAGAWRGLQSRLPGRIARSTSAAPVLVLFAVLVALLWEPGNVAGNRNWALLAPVALALGGGLLLLATWTARAPEGRPPPAFAWASLRPLHYALLALLLVNVATPYLGIKTVGTFTMYSNLDTFEGRSNHFFLPRVPGPTLHDDLVEVVSTSNRRLERLRQRGLRVTWVQLRREGEGPRRPHLVRPRGPPAHLRPGRRRAVARHAQHRRAVAPRAPRPRRRRRALPVVRGRPSTAGPASAGVTRRPLRLRAALSAPPSA